jgi:hypothetical protein
VQGACYGLEVQCSDVKIVVKMKLFIVSHSIKIMAELKERIYDEFMRKFADDAYGIIKRQTKKSLDRFVDIETKQKSTGKPVRVKLPFPDKRRYVTVDLTKDMKDKMGYLQRRWDVGHNVWQLGFLTVCSAVDELTGKHYEEGNDYKVFANPKLYVRALSEIKKEGHVFFSDFEFNEEKLLNRLSIIRKKEKK